MSQPAADEFDPLGMIRILNEHEVRYVVIGGIAAGVQGAIWATTGLDITHERDRSNHQRLAAALHDLGAVAVDLPPGVQVILDERILASGTNWTLMTRLGRLDLLGEPGEGLDYAALRRRARRIEGHETYLVAAVEDLIAMKQAAGRPKDAGQVELLRMVAEERSRRNDLPS
jgi:hypothetical protein